MSVACAAICVVVSAAFVAAMRRLRVLVNLFGFGEWFAEVLEEYGVGVGVGYTQLGTPGGAATGAAPAVGGSQH